MIRRVLMIATRLVLGAILVWAAYAKLSNPWLTFASQIGGYKLVPDEFLEPMAKYLPWVEMFVGVGLIVGFLQKWFGLAATLLFSMFIFALVHSYVLKLDIDCGCFGTPEKLTIWRILEDSAMLIAAAAFTVTAFLKRKTV